VDGCNVEKWRSTSRAFTSKDCLYRDRVPIGYDIRPAVSAKPRHKEAPSRVSFSDLFVVILSFLNYKAGMQQVSADFALP
jgi:hypothetical protein